MSAVEQLLQELTKLGIRLWTEDNRLRFDAPKGAFNPDLREKLKGVKEELIDYLSKATQPTQEEPEITIVPRDGRLPLSFAQQRLWLLDQLRGGSQAYHIPLSMRIKGPFSTGTLSRVLIEVVRRHESLRTTFRIMEGDPVQVLAPPGDQVLGVVDLCALTPGDIAEKAVALAVEEAKRPFDLIKGPLFRATLLRLDDQEHQLLLTMHHIISDGWSMGVLIGEVTHLYQAYAAGSESTLADLPLQYPDFAAWQRQWLSADVLDRQMRYWVEQLAGAPDRLTLPTDFPHKSKASFRGERFEIRLDQELTRAVRDFSAQSGTTLFMTLLTAFYVLLYRYSGQDDIMVGTPIANRTRRILEKMIGFFVNTLVLRQGLNGDPTFQELLTRTRKVALDAFSNQDVPFEKLVETLSPERNLSYSPLFQVMFIVQNAQRQQLTLPGLSLEREKSSGAFAKFDLTLSISESPDQLTCTWEFATDLFERITVQRIAKYYRNLLQEMTANPGQSINRVSFMGLDEKQHLISSWNLIPPKPATDSSLKQLFEQCAANHGDEVALITRDKQTGSACALTYAALNDWANHIAHELIGHGVGSGSMVGLCSYRSAEMLAGMLGIVKTGAAYVSLDPKYPKERLEIMLREIHGDVLLCQKGCEEVLPENEGELITLSSQAPAGKAPVNPVVTTHLDQPAYVLFTSGSTGKPKGVVISQRSVLQLIRWAEVNFSPEDRQGVLAGTSINFDLSVFELLVTFCLGGRVILVENLLELLEWEDMPPISLINTVPSAMKELLLQKAVPETVRVINLAGEPLPGSLVRDIGLLPQSPRINNLYGPSEDTTYSTGDICDPAAGQEPTIGRPIEGTQAYVLDAFLEPMPLGVPGELLLGGEGLAQGYHLKPGMTAEKFIPDPFHSQPGSRLYRTGDLVRRLGDGRLDFTGRIDNQVKIRGFRIELGEIESVLRGYDTISDCCVIARQKVPGVGNKILVAFVVCLGSTDPIQVKDWLGRDLPDYMVPSLVIPLEELPLTPNGKINRNALGSQSLDGQVTTKRAEYMAPRSPTEETLVAIWSNVLQQEGIGVLDNFFELGGHSLLVTRVMSQIRDQLEVNIPLGQMFDHPTVSELAKAVDSSQGQRNVAPPLVKGIANNPAPLSFAQQRLWFLDQMYPMSSAYNISIALMLEGPVHLRAGLQTFREMIRRHESLRTNFITMDGEAVQQVREPFEPPVIIIDTLSLPDEESRMALGYDLAALEMRKPFDLTTDPLIRFTLIPIAKDKHIFIITIHHIISDAWSLGVFRNESFTLYRHYRLDQEHPMPDLPVQYADFATWQRNWLEEGEIQKQLAYWRQKLEGMPKFLELPFDHPGRKDITGGGHQEEFVFDEALTQKIRALASEASATLFMTLLATFKVFLQKYSGQNDILVGSLIANRTQSVLETLIGFFVNTLVLRTRFDEDPSFFELLGRVKRTALDAYSNQDLPFERLVEALQPRRDLSHSPLFQAMFILQIEDFDPRPLPLIKMTKIDPGKLAPQFNFILTVTVSGDILRITLDAQTGLFEPATLKRMAQNYKKLVHEVVANYRMPLSKLDILSESEHSRLLTEWNSQQGPIQEGPTHIHQLLEARAAITPNALALIVPAQGNGLAQTYTYDQLNREANRLAHYLIGKGLGSTIQGLCMDRGPEALISMIAILKSGGAYLPMDPKWPADRMAFIADDAGAAAVLTRSHDRAHLIETKLPIIELDLSSNDIPEAWGNPNLQIDGREAAFVIYTSGTTGRPKGIIVPHQAVVNHATACIDTYKLGPEDRVLQFAFLCFDVAAEEIYPTWACGATLVLRPQELFPTFNAFGSFVAEYGLTVLNLPAAYWHEWVSDLERLGHVPWKGLRLLIVGSDRVLPDKWTSWLKMTGIPCVNAYGPSEATITATMTGMELSLDHYSVPIGRPIRNMQAHILDPRLYLVPIGAHGELCLGGIGLAWGYLGRSALTAASFVPNPFALDGAEGARLYRTGDRARFLPDGQIEFLGRIDHQVKIRGFRVELGEIENIIRKHKDVEDCLVLMREHQPGDGNRVLVVFVVTLSGGDVDPIRRSLRRDLPDYMVPAALITLDEMPKNANGKVDRKVLETIPLPGSAIMQRYVAPRTPTEEILTTIWCEVLKRETISVLDNFFEMGGHSILATRVMSRVNENFETVIPLRKIFEFSTIEELAAVIEQSALDHAHAPPLIPRTREGQIPLSFAQQRLWFLDRIEPGSAAYNMPAALRMKGRLDTTSLKHAFDTMIDRHESIRTNFGEEDGQAIQIIRDAGPAEWQVHDLTAMSVEDRLTHAHILAAEDAGTPFDLTSDPLLRLTLVKLADDDHVLVFTMHHIISDGWSMGIFIRELVALYRHYTAGRSGNPLAPMAVQYADFSLWQRQWLSGEVLLSQVQYWKEKLEGIPKLLNMPTDQQRPVVGKQRGNLYYSSLSIDLHKSLHNLSHATGTTLFMVLQAAFSILLGRLSNQNDIVIGTPVAGRTRTSLEGLIGFFVNTLCLRVRLEGNPSFRALLSQVRQTALEAYAHQDIPFEKLVEELNPERSLAHSPIFQVIFSLSNANDEERVSLPDLEIEQLSSARVTAKFDLTLMITERKERFDCTWEYNTDLFQASTIERFAQCFHLLLEGLTDRPDQPIFGLPMLSDGDRDQVIARLQREAPSQVDSLPIHERVSAWARQTPAAIAVVPPASQPMSYLALDLLSDNVAGFLMKEGIGLGDKVGLYLDRGVELIACILGVLKTGAAYVALEPGLPVDRIAFISEDARISILLTTNDLRTSLPRLERPVAHVDDLLQAPVIDISLPRVDPEMPAYVIYTSGSTGKPKGVLINHRNIAAQLAGFSHLTGLSGPPVGTCVASFNFDVAVWEMYMTLCYGGALHLVQPEQLQDPKAFAAMLIAKAITQTYIPPGILAEVVDGLAQRDETVSLELVLLGVEPIPQELTARLASLSPRLTVANAYGPTEATVTAMAYLFDQETSLHRRTPIGKALPGYGIYLADSQLQQVPAGIEGEILISGPGLSSGYLGLPGTTAKYFVPNPLEGNGARLYRTGDRACLLANGQVEFRGRIDHQVKVRGYRVELGEIEMVLASHPEINEAAVMFRQIGTGEQQIAAYIVQPTTKDPVAPDPAWEEDLRKWLGRQLPAYMIPSGFVLMPTLPLTASGKVDRHRLPDPADFMSHEWALPATPTEKRLQEIWSDLLGRPGLGVLTNFFSAGGHSLLAARLLNQVSQVFGVSLPLASLFQESTIRQMAKRLDQGIADTSSILVPINQKQGKTPFFCVHPVSGDVLCYRALARDLTFPFYGLQFPALVGQAAPDSFIGLAKLYVTQIRKVQPHGPYHLGGWSLGGLIALEMARELGAMGEEVARLVLFDTHPDPTGGQVLPHVSQLQLEFISNLGAQVGKWVKGQPPELDLEKEEGLQWLSGHTPGLSPPQVGQLWQAFKAMRVAEADYTPQPYDGDLVLFSAQGGADPAHLVAQWRALAGSRMQVIPIPGNHFTLFQQPYVGHLAEQLSRILA